MNRLNYWTRTQPTIDQVRRILSESPDAWLNAAQIARELERFGDSVWPSAHEIARALWTLKELGEVESRELPGPRPYWHPRVVWRRRADIGGE